MDRLYNLNAYFKDYRLVKIFFDTLIKQSINTKDVILKELNISYPSYNRIKDNYTCGSANIVMKLENYFNLSHIDKNKMEEYNIFINDFLIDLYYGRCQIKNHYSIIHSYIKENNYLRPLFILLILIVDFIDSRASEESIKKNKEAFHELRKFKSFFSPTPIYELFMILEMIYSKKLLLDNSIINFDNRMKGIVLSTYVLNAYLMKEYGLCLFYIDKCKKILIEDHNFRRLNVLYLWYFDCLNSTGQYHKCMEESFKHLLFLQGEPTLFSLVEQVKKHYYVACLACGKYKELVEEILHYDEINKYPHIYLLACYKYNIEIYNESINKVLNECDEELKEDLVVIIEFLKNLKDNKKLIYKSKLNYGLKQILLNFY